MNFVFLYMRVIFFIFQFLFAKDFSESFYIHNYKNISFDRGINWDSITSLNAVNTDYVYGNSPIYKNYFTVVTNGNSFHLRNLKYIKYKKNFYFYIYPESRYLIDTNKKKISFQIKSNGFGFKNKWFFAQIGKGKEDWGAGEDISLILSKKSKPYNYLMIGSDYGKIRVKYFHSFLERIDDVNRYLVGRIFEWTNKKSLILSFSEVIIYSGVNRQFDLAYLNPISSHLEIDSNNRSNIGSAIRGANAVWQFSIDWIYKNKLRLSGNFIVDEYELDKKEINNGGGHRTGISTRLSYNFVNNNIHYLNFYLAQIQIDELTFRHASGYNNFTFNNNPLGWEHGSDANESTFGLKYSYNGKIISNLLVGKRRSGIDRLLENPYDENKKYNNGALNIYPIDVKFFSFIFDYKLRDNFYPRFKFKLIENNFDELSFTSIISINFSL
jgi:hypothetical protein